MRGLKAIFLCAALASGAPAWAGDTKVVVELFTSQGCSSCPPADALMERLAKKDHVIALAFHVDYWDYIGWKDSFADPAYTKRQKSYAHVAGRNMVYTPQMIVNGVDQVVGAHAMELADLIVAHAALPPQAEVIAKRDGNMVRVGLLPLGDGLNGRFLLQLVRYSDKQTVDITSGENAGRTITYFNVVDGWETIGDWDGRTPKTVEATILGDRPAVVLVQQEGPGPIVAAARVD